MSQSPRWPPMWQKKERKERNGEEYKEREGVKRVFDGGRDVWDVFHRNMRPSVKEMMKMSKSWKSGENKRREMFSKKPETVLAERKGRHLPGGARHSPGCSEISFDLAAMVSCFDFWWFDDEEEGYDCSGDGGDAGFFWWGTLKFLKVGNSSKKTNLKPAEDDISQINVPSDFLGRTNVVIATRCSESQSPPLVSNTQRVHNVLKIARMTNANSLGKH